MSASRAERPAVLCVGGLDPTGGAGVLADAAAVRVAGAHPAAVIASIAIQDGRSFVGSHALEASVFASALKTVLGGIDIRAVKTGALGGRAAVEVLAGTLRAHERIPLVVDPVVRSSTGGELLDDEGVAALRSRLFPLAALVTPNIAEAELFSGIAIRGPAEMAEAGREILAEGPTAVLVKGGHLGGDRSVDVLVSRRGGTLELSSPRVAGRDVRGTGCALASLIAARLACGVEPAEAVRTARDTLRVAIENAVAVGPGPPVPGWGPRARR
ncbi:MAG: hydroxymethylpyrimidine/phosphomethylpyrimidine kinase [Polyangia bacterium]